MAKNFLQKLTNVRPRPDPVPAPREPGAPEIIDAEPVPIRADTGSAARVGLWTLAIGFGGFLLWAAFAPLDEGVPSTGTVAIDTKRKTVQHLSGGIVKDVMVREGDKVREGQLLIRLDEATTRANYESTRQQYLGMRAIQGRLLAEQSGADKVNFHPDLVKAAGEDPLIRSQMQTQESLFHSRRAALRAELSAIEQTIQGTQAVIQASQSVLASRRSQLGLISEELTQTRDLVKDGYAPRNRQLELERMVAEANASMAELQGNTARAHATIAELRQRALARQQDYRKEVESQLTDVSKEVEANESKFTALKNDLQRTEIRSPASGQVVGLAVQTVGGVIQGGQKLMDIVPERQELMLESQVPPHLIDRVHAGLPVDVRFNAFAHSPQLVVDGKIVSISGDLLTDPNTNVSYYLARVAVTPEGYKKLGTHQLQPGMPVEVILKTGERSLLTYLLQPLTRRMAAAMKEE